MDSSFLISRLLISCFQKYLDFIFRSLCFLLLLHWVSHLCWIREKESKSYQLIQLVETDVMIITSSAEAKLKKLETMTTLLKEKFLDVEEKLEYIQIPGKSNGFQEDAGSTLSRWVIVVHHEFFGSCRRGKGDEAKWRAKRKQMHRMEISGQSNF